MPGGHLGAFPHELEVSIPPICHGHCGFRHAKGRNTLIGPAPTYVRVFQRWLCSWSQPELSVGPS